MTPSTRLNPSPLARVLGLFPGRLPEQDPRVQHVLDQLPAAAFLIFHRTRTILTVNGKAAALTEWTRDELTARSLTNIVALPSAEGEALAPFDLMEPGSLRSWTAVPLRTRSGRLVFVDLRLSALQESGETVVLALAIPVEERLAQEREAAQQTRALEAIQHLLALFASPTEETLEWVVQITREMLAADAAGFYRVTPHQPGLRLHTLACVNGVASTFPEVIGPGEAHSLMAPLRWASGQRTETFLHQSVRAAGWAHFVAQPVGEPPAILGTLFAAYRPGHSPSAQTPALLAIAARQTQQLIAQIARESKLANAQQLAIRLSGRLAAINAQIEEGVVILNYEGTIDEINGAAAQMLGYRSEDIIGLPFGDVLISDGALHETIRASLGGDITEALEDRLHRRSGEPFPVMARLRPLPEWGCVLTLRDLSETRASEVHREHLDHLAYVGQSTESFAHEVRAPLNNISTGVQYLAARLPPDETVQAAFSKIQAECSRLSDLMNDMLAWAKPVDPKLEPTDLAALLKRLTNRWSTKIQQRNVRLTFSADECPRVLADPRLIERVFVNLIENALQAMPAGGDLYVTLRMVNRGPQGYFVETRVADSGPGISEEVRRHIFDPYFTTKPDGTGLGLAICKRLVTVHHGAINVECFPASGTIFIVALPAYDPSRVKRSLPLENPK